MNLTYDWWIYKVSLTYKKQAAHVVQLLDWELCFR